jgi:2-octaprenyl-6-methoxyphenol hydroxylase
MQHLNSDLAIIGGGLLGYTAALAFAQAGLRVILLEAKAVDLSQLQGTEGRAIALALTSCYLYQSLGLWPELAPHATPIQEVLISEQTRFGKCRISAHDYDLPALGQVIPATDLFAALYQAAQAHPQITIVAPYAVQSIESTETDACINGEMHAKWVLACDGTQSFARDYFQLKSTEKKYEKHALVANLTLSRPHEGRAIQRFTERGVLALLPLPGQRMTSVLTFDSAELEALQSLEPDHYLRVLQELAGTRAGLFRDLGKRFAYPLIWLQTQEIVAGRTVLLGNAAQTLSPLAAQGLNLALRDLGMLYDTLMAGAPLEDYAKASREAQGPVLRFTDQLMDWATPDSLGFLRSAGLFALDHLPFLKDSLAHSLMGLSPHGGSLMRRPDHE